MGELRAFAQILVFLVASSLLYTPSLGARKAEKEEELLIGWQGETYQTPAHDDDKPREESKPKAWVQVLSWRPRAFLYHNFLSDAEVRHVLKLSAYQMKRSMVVGPNDTGVVDSVRTSAGTFLGRNLDPIITSIEARLALWSQLPPSHQEDMQVLRYGPSNKYGAHVDGLGRVMSVLIYLIPPEEGGETAFPQTAGWLHPEMGEPSQGNFSACAKGHVAYKPQQGDALMFFDLDPSYKNEDPYSEHTGCPVIKGTKWNAVKWIHGKPFHPEAWEESLKAPSSPYPDPGDCLNLHAQCEEWRDQGECKKNPGYMIGNADGRGNCRKACDDCIVCAKGDEKCLNENRASGGYLILDKAEFKGMLD